MTQNTLNIHPPRRLFANSPQYGGQKSLIHSVSVAPPSHCFGHNRLHNVIGKHFLREHAISQTQCLFREKSSFVFIYKPNRHAPSPYPIFFQSKFPSGWRSTALDLMEKPILRCSNNLTPVKLGRRPFYSRQLCCQPFALHICTKIRKFPFAFPKDLAGSVFWTPPGPILSKTVDAP